MARNHRITMTGRSPLWYLWCLRWWLANAGVAADITSTAANNKSKDLLHFCSSNSSLMDLSRDFHFGFLAQRLKHGRRRRVCSQLLTLAGDSKLHDHSPDEKSLVSWE